MQHSSPPPESLFVPSVPAELRGAPIAGLVVLVGGIAMLVGEWLPWQIVRFRSRSSPVSVLPTYHTLMLVLGALTVLAGLIMRIKAIPTARLLARLIGVLAGSLGGYALYQIGQVNTSEAVIQIVDPARLPVATFGSGLYIVGIGALLAVVGSFLQRAAPAPRRVG